jgi:hypothetical protein
MQSEQLFVVAETHTLLMRRIHGDVALSFAQQIQLPPQTVVSSTLDIEDHAINDWLKRYTDQDSPLTHAVSFAVMSRRGIGKRSPWITTSRSRSHDGFGDEITNELVDWFNHVDATYRNDLRELNELNFQRFDAKLEQRIADLRSEMRVGFANVEARFGKLERQMDTRFAQQRGDLEERLGAQMKWMFGFWLSTLLPLAAS